MGEFSSSRLFMPGPLKLRESAHERGEARFMVFAIKQSLVPSPERRFHRKVEEATKRMSLDVTDRVILDEARMHVNTHTKHLKPSFHCKLSYYTLV
jgi:hypothetical protein